MCFIEKSSLKEVFNPPPYDQSEYVFF